jgi:hypothetical protein
MVRWFLPLVPSNTNSSSDAFLERHQRILSFEAAPRRAVSNLQNWVDGNGCIARDETAYLGRGSDLLSVATSDDNIIRWLEALIEDSRVYLRERFGRVTSPRPISAIGEFKPPRQPRLDVSRDPNVHIFPPSSMTCAVRILLIPFIIVLILAPVIICNFVHSLTARLVIIVASTTSFVAVLSSFAKVRTVELVVAGATCVCPPSSNPRLQLTCH